MRTYGTATLLRAGTWSLKLEPHVAMRFKRMFPAVAPRASGHLDLSNTDENCRDLAWFCERYPLRFRPPEAESKLHGRAQEADRRAEIAQAILTGTYEPAVVDMAEPPRGYQQQAADLCLTTGGLLVADELGLGKTVTAITLLAHEEARPAICVVPTHLQTQWRNELRRFLPGLRVHIARKGSPDYLWAGGGQGSLLAEEQWPPDVLILTYHKLGGWRETLMDGPFQAVVVDECQELRRAASVKYVAAAGIGRCCRYRLGLSATPIYNYGGEFFNVLDVLRPEALGTREEFLQEWCGGGQMGDKARIEQPAVFGSHLREQALMVRRTRAEVGRELPALTNIVHEFEPEPERLREAEGRATELARVLMEANKGWDRLQAAEELSSLLRLATGLAKAPYIAEFIRLLIEESGEPVVLFGWHRAVYGLWAERLADLEPAWFTGHETPARKDKEKARFLAGDTPLIIVSLRAGQGLDGLQRVCHRAVFGELDWSPGVHEQCVGRVHRDGQGEPTLAYYMAATDGADPIIMDVLGVKRGQITQVRDPAAALAVPQQADPDHMQRLAQAYLQRHGASHA